MEEKDIIITMKTESQAANVASAASEG